ncbi:MAG: DNA primase catalytic subunit PriS [Methanobacteriaceae archaeon]|nr:DNA primase catalytic subunit PriS [Methanobacteriaceae archaeon]
MKLKPATSYERKLYYEEEWDIKNVPNFIIDSITSREFGFDHYGQGPNDRYKTFIDKQRLKRFLKTKHPFAAYSSVAFYKKPEKRGGWIKSELVFDVDAKDIPIRTCDCAEGNICETCLNQAKEIVLNIDDILKEDFGLKDIHYVYSGRGYHIRILDESATSMDSNMRGQIVQYVTGANVPDLKNDKGYDKLQHFSVDIGYPRRFTESVKYTINHLTKNSELENVNQKLLNDVIKNRQVLNENQWGLFRQKIGPIRYNKVINAIARINMGITDTKVSIDLKRILRLPSTLHSKVSMKSTLIKNIEIFDPFDDAVPKFVYERK